MTETTQPKESKAAQMPATASRKKREKREKIEKERLHIYIPTETINRIDTKAEDSKVNRNVMIQMLLNYALKNLKTV